MLVGKGQLLDLQIVTYAQQAVDVNAEGMCSQFRVKASTKAAECASGVGFDREFYVELTGDCFDDLANDVVDARDECRELNFLVSAWLSEQADAIVLPEFVSC